MSGMRSFSNSLVNILTPVIAAAILALAGLQLVIWIDLITFAIAFFALLFLVRIPEIQQEQTEQETVLRAARAGLRYLKQNRGILDLILFLAAINLTASIYSAALPAMLLSRAGGGEAALGAVNAVTGLAMLAGSAACSLLPAPKGRVRVIMVSLLISMSTENFLLAFGRTVPVWCIGAVTGWLFIPMMGANMEVLFRNRIPVSMQGRVFSVRNTLQFFTIPIGYFLGGILVDRVFEPFMARRAASSRLTAAFGMGKGSGAALLFFVIAFIGILTCLYFWRDRHIWGLEQAEP